LLRFVCKETERELTNDELRTSFPEESQLLEGKNVEDSVIFLTEDKRILLKSSLERENPIFIDIDRELSYHLKTFKETSINKQPLYKALGLSKGEWVDDLTAGLLGDSLLMVSMGLNVRAYERHIVPQLLITNALKNSTLLDLTLFKFFPKGASYLLDEDLSGRTLYFDPMFEDPNHKTAPKKEMRIFREVVSVDHDAEELLEKLIQKRPKRLVVKRPIKSRVLGRRPSHSIEGKSTRYDVYL
jgi:16S rRNA (guanine1516-N2)-methyltransferase